jgi:hypothetical protein
MQIKDLKEVDDACTPVYINAGYLQVVYKNRKA